MKFPIFEDIFCQSVDKSTHPMLLYADIRQMYVHIVQLCHTRIIFDRTKSTKAQLEQIRFQRPKWRHQHIQSQIEFLAADQQWIVDVSRDHVTLFARSDLWIEGIAARLTRPFLQFGQFVDQKNAGALWFAWQINIDIFPYRKKNFKYRFPTTYRTVS